MDYAKESLRLHYDWKGKLETAPRAAVADKDALSLAYTPGVAQPCLEIQKDISKSYELTRRWNTVAVITDGTAVLGLGDIGPEAGMSVCRLLLSAGFWDITLCDKTGIICEDRTDGMNPYMVEMSKHTNRAHKTGKLADALVGADIFLGFSAPNLVTADMVRTMNRDAIIFACANPTPEIFPDDAKAGGAAVVSTGRSDYPNQINNVLAFPGIFRGALDARDSDINDAMKIAAAHALADLISDEELSADYIIPAAFDPRVKDAVAAAVKQAAYDSGVARI